MLTSVDDPRVLRVMDWAKSQEPKPTRRTLYLKLEDEGINEYEIDDILEWYRGYFR